MKDVFDLKSYKNYLENYYVFSKDKNSLKVKQAVEDYGDEYLQKIVDDTKTFALYLMNKLAKEKNNFVNLKEEIKDIDQRIDNNLYGGFMTDRLYNPIRFGENFWVSEYLLKSFFKDLSLYVTLEANSIYNDEEKTHTFTFTPYFYIEGKRDSFENLCSTEEAREEKIIKFIKVLKKSC